MGYRSDVYIKTTRDGYKKLRKEIAKEDKTGLDLLDNYGKFYFNKNENTITIEMQYMKWYDMNKDVNAIDTAIDEISEKYPVHFIRLGDNIDDIEDDYRYPDGFSGDFDCLELYRYVKPIGEEVDKDFI